MVANYTDEADDLVLHWGMSRDKVGLWGAPDLAILPQSSKLMDDGFAAQSVFQREPGSNSIRTISFTIEHECEEKAVQSISFVLLEKNKNQWHSFNG